MPLFSQVRVSSVKDPAACPFNGLVSCGTAFLSFRLGSGFQLVGASTPRPYKLDVDRVEGFPGSSRPVFTAAPPEPAIRVGGKARQTLDGAFQPIGGSPGRNFETRSGLDLGATATTPLNFFVGTVTETPRAMVIRYTAVSESIAGRVDQAIEVWAAACNTNRATGPCAEAFSNLLTTLQHVRLDLAEEAFASGAPWVTRLALDRQNQQLGLAYGEMEQGFRCWDGACNGDRGTSMGPRAATAFEEGADRRVRVDDALGKLLIAGN